MAESITDCDHDLVYEKRPGTDNEGHDYELLLTALYAVKLALDGAVRDIQMASNVDKYGAFDDIVIRVQYKNGTTILYLLQLKHKKKVHGSIDFINKIKGDFSLEKYKDSYYKDVKERISNGELDDLLKGVELKDVVPCLFTNAVYSKDTNKIILNERESLSCKALPCSDTDFIDTTSKGYQTFQMHTERPKFAQFLNSHSLTGYQRGFEDRVKKIQEKFEKSEASRVKKICNSFKDKLKIEIQKDEMNFDSILIRLSELVKELFKEVDSYVLEEMSDYFRDEYQSARKLYEEYSSKCAGYSEFFKQFKFYSGQLNCKQVKTAIASRIQESLGKCPPKVVRKFIDYIQDYFEDNRLLVKQQIQKKLLEVMLPQVHSEEDFEKRFQIFQMVTDLNDPEQKLIVSKHIQVALQGRKDTRLFDIVDTNFCQSQEPEFFLNHMGSVIQVGKTLELKCENYIKREFAKVYVRNDVFMECTTCIFIISLMDRSYFEDSSETSSSESLLERSDSESILEISDKESILRFSDSESILRFSDSESILRFSDSESILENSDSESILETSDSESILENSDSESVLNKSDSDKLSENSDSESILKNSDSMDDMQDEMNVIDLRNGENLPQHLASDSKNYAIVISNEGDIDDKVETWLKSISLNGKTVHYLKEINFDLVEWRGSRNNMYTEYQKDFFSSCFTTEDDESVKEESFIEIEDSVKEEVLLQYFKSTVNIISAEPGMGKSTVLDSLIQYCPSKKWVLKLKLNEWNDDLYDKSKEILEDPLQYIFEKSEEDCNNKFSKDLFSYMKSRDAVMVFIDAFDEISPKYTDVVLELISKVQHLGISTWIFTRPNLEKCLEKNFNTAAIKLLPLKENDIREYLVMNKKIDELSLDGLLQKMMEFLKIPLHLYMLSTVLCSETLNRNTLKVTDLYEIFITTKCHIYYEKFGIKIKGNHVEDLVPTPEELIEKHQLLSLFVIYDKNVFINTDIASDSEFERLLSEIKAYKNHLGIVTAVHGSFPVFAHRTFAEFLTARWLSKNRKHKAFKRMYKNLEDFDNILLLFYDLISAEYPLHAAVAAGDLELVRELCNQPELVLCDFLNRTPLHLAMVCFSYFIHQDVYEISKARTKVACKITNEICEHLANTKSFLSQKDIFNCYWLKYAKNKGIFFGSCYWGCNALLMMNLARNYFLKKKQNKIHKGIKCLIRGNHINCLKLLLVCDIFGEFQQIKSILGVESIPDAQMNEYLWENFESELVYALKFFIANDSPYKSDPRFKQRFYNQRIFKKFLEDAKRKFEARCNNSLEEQEKSLGLTSITQNLNILERIEMVTKIQMTGCTPLCAAAFLGYLDSVKSMGSVGANPGDEFKLHYAIEGGNVEVITWLIKTGVDVNQKDANGNVLLSRIMKNRFLHTDTKFRIMELLIKNGADATVKECNGKSSFELAAYDSNLDVVKLFVENGVHVDYRDNENKSTALHHAIKLKRLKYVKYFLGKGADVNIKVDGKTSLDIALDTNIIYWQIVRLLMKRNANVNYLQNLRVFVPLIRAFEANQLKVAQHVVNEQFDVTTTTNASKLWTSLSVNSLFILRTARSETYTFIHELLIKSGKNSCAVLFSSAIKECYTNFRKFANKDKIYITARLLNETSPFGKAIQNEDWELVKLFIEIGIYVDYRDFDNKFTALQKAVKRNRPEYVKYFIDREADVNLKVCEKTSLDLALENKTVNWEMVKLLVESGADVNCRQNQRGYTPLHYAVEEDRLDMVEFLVNKEADVFITDGSDARTPLQLAIHLGGENIKNFLAQRVFVLITSSFLRRHYSSP